MKKSIILLYILITSICNGQTNDKIKADNFEYTEIGLNDYVITEIEGMTKEEIYNKALNWVKETYKNPEVVLKMKIENEKLRIEAIAIDLLKVKGFSSNLSYIIEISFRDNKYRFELSSLLYENTVDYKKIPNFKTDKKMLKNFGNTPIDIENYFNRLNQGMKDYIIGKSEDKW
jgi:hypothetical protein